jgi:hypothetical protein
MTRWCEQLNPAQIRRDVAAGQQHLVDLSLAKGHPNQVPAPIPFPGIQR